MLTSPATKRELRYFVVVILLRSRAFEISSIVSPFFESFNSPMIFR